MPIQLCAFFIPRPQSNFWQSSRSDQHRLCYYVGTYVAIWDMILQLGSLVPNFSYCSVDALVMYLQTSSTHMVVNFHYSCRLQWLASMSELLEKWVSVTLPSPGNAPMIGSNILGYIRIPHRRGSFVISSSPISHTMFHMFQKPNCFFFFSGHIQLSPAISTCLLKQVDFYKPSIENLVGWNSSSELKSWRDYQGISR